MPQSNYTNAFYANFLGHAPDWYKGIIIGFLIINPILALTAGNFVAGWVLIAEFIFCLAMALKCYPLLPGGLLAIEAVLMGLTTAAGVYKETVANFSVILVLMFMVAGIYFMNYIIEDVSVRGVIPNLIAWINAEAEARSAVGAGG